MTIVPKSVLLCMGVFLFLQYATLSHAAMPRGIEGLYEITQDNLFWTGSGQIKKNRDEIATIIDNASSHGISVSPFFVDELRALSKVDDLSPDDMRRVDNIYTYALWEYARQLNGGPLLDTQFIEIALSSDVKKQIEKLAPKSPLYYRLKERLAEIDELISQRDEQEKTPVLTFGGQILHVGDTHADVPLLRARMVEYDTGASFGDDPYRYDAILADAVKVYQAKNGLKADGIVGPSTLKYINRTVEGEREQIVLNMKRLRDPIWRNRPDLRVDVDVARYWLTAYENGVVAFEMPVVVGSKKRQTNLFSTVMTGVRLNPGWTLPPTIKTEDYIPKLRKNPEWVSEQGVQIYADWSHDSEPIDPMTVDWSMLSDGEIKAMRMYKSAGAGNPLGSYRFLMHNKYDIYLHDTNAKGLFNRDFRAKSSGCVRIHDPRKMAEFLLKDNPSWTSEKIDEVLASGRTYDVGAKRHIPVYFDYKTAWLDENDTLVLGNDVYGFDKEVKRDILNASNRIKQTLSNLLEPLNLEKPLKSESNDTQGIFPISLF